MTRPSAGKPRRPVAVALKHQIGSSQLPRVVASGKGHVAEQILELAFANGVRVREDADLVEVLSAVDVDTEIPLEAIVAVAEILAHVYRANGTLTPDPGPIRQPDAEDSGSAPDPAGTPSPTGYAAADGSSSLWMAGSDLGMLGDDLSDGPAITLAPLDSSNDKASPDSPPDRPPSDQFTSDQPMADPSPGQSPNEKGQP